MSASGISLLNDVVHDEHNHHYNIFSESRYEDAADRFVDDHDHVRAIQILRDTPNALLEPNGNNG